MYTLTETSEKTQLKDYQLRTYEDRLGLTIARNEQGHRIYSEEDIQLLIQVRELKQQGLSLEVIKQKLFPKMPAVEEQKSMSLQNSKITQLKGEELVQLMKEQQQAFVEEFMVQLKEVIREEVAVTVREEVKEELIVEVKQELQRQEEQKSSENQKLLKAIQELRERTDEIVEDKKKKKFLLW